MIDGLAWFGERHFLIIPIGIAGSLDGQACCSPEAHFFPYMFGDLLRIFTAL